jgi:hypothetical protein
MTLVVPDPTRTVPLPLRQQADVRDRWLTQRLLDLLPALMDRTGIDLWIVAGRENNEDPVMSTLLPAAWLSARRRTCSCCTAATTASPRSRCRATRRPVPGRLVAARG